MSHNMYYGKYPLQKDAVCGTVSGSYRLIWLPPGLFRGALH
jgi:hypothetical protein